MPRFSGGTLFKARDDAQHGGLAAAGGSQQRDKFAVAEHLVKIPDDHVVLKGLGDVADRYTCHCSRSFLMCQPFSHPQTGRPKAPQMENSPPVRRFRMKFSSTTINSMPKAMAQLMGWLVIVQYSYSWKPMVLVLVEYSSVVMDNS